MPLIYVKLGVDIHEFDDEDLSFHMDDDMPVGIMDYSNLNSNIFNALNAGTIIQINEGEYFTTLNGLAITPDIQVTTNYLLTLDQFMNACPVGAFVMFGYHDGKWYKILWSKMVECLVGGLNISFRVGNAEFPAPNYPQNGDNDFTNPNLIGKDPLKLVVRTGGVEIYYRDYYTNAEIISGDVDYWDLDPETGLFSRPALAFADTEFFSIREA